MNDPDDIEKTVSKWFKEDAELLSAVQYAQDVIKIIEDLSKERRSIGKYIIEESGLTKVAIATRIRVLLGHGLIVQRKGEKYWDVGRGKKVYDGRVKLHELTERGRKIAEYMKLYELPEAPSAERRIPTSGRFSANAKLFHSARLRELLKDMANQIPLVSTTEIYHPTKCRPITRYDGGPLPIENEILLGDLQNHLIDFEKFDRSYSDFKEWCKKFRQLKDEILMEIELDVRKNFAVQLSSSWNEPNSFSPNMLEWIFEAGVYLSGKNLKRHFREYFLDFESRIEKGRFEGREKVEYWIGGRGFLQVMREHNEAEVLKQETDNNLKSFMEKLRKASYYQKIGEAHGFLDRAAKLREELLRMITRNLEVPIFGGRCEFLDAALKTG